MRAAPLVKMSRTVSRVMSRIIIYLGLPLPAVSSNLPESRPGKPVAFCLVLLRMGFTCAPPVTRRAVVSYTAFPPLPGSAPQRIAPFRQRRGGIFLLHWPWSRLHRTLSGILPCEARTFLTCRRADAQTDSRDYSFYSFPPVYYTAFPTVLQVPDRGACPLRLSAPASCGTCKTVGKPFYTRKQLPPTNSRRIELFGRFSLLTPRKYSRNFSSRLASKYSGSSLPIPYRRGSANCFSTASS